MIYAVKVKPMNNYLLLIRFNNGEERVFNCCPLLEENIYAELKDKDFFDSVYIDENGLVCWSESTDINPDYLYDNSELVSNMTFETMLNSIKGSFNIEGMNMSKYVEDNIKKMENGEKTIEECIAETKRKYKEN